MSWQEEINKKLEEQRASFKEAQESGETFRRKQSYASKSAHNKPESRAKILEGLEKARNNGASSKGGQTNVRTGHLAKVRDPKKASDIAKEQIVCEVCGISSSTGNYSRFHGKKCIYNLVTQLLDALPEEFTYKQAKQVNEELNLPKNMVRKLISDMWGNMIEQIYQGKNGSHVDVSIYKKRAFGENQ